jgi:hypothetical protein
MALRKIGRGKVSLMPKRVYKMPKNAYGYDPELHDPSRRFVGEKMTPEEIAARNLKEPVKRVREEPKAPEGKGGKLWRKMYDDNVKGGFAEPERMADAFLRAREKGVELVEGRKKTRMT